MSDGAANATELPAGIHDLEPIEPGAMLPAPVSRPVLAVPVDGLLRVVALDWESGKIVHTALDASGVPAVATVPLPLTGAEAIAAAGHHTLIAGTRESDAASIVMVVSAMDDCLAQHPFPLHHEVLMPRIAATAGQLHILWSTAAERGTIWLAGLDARGIHDPAPFGFDDPSTELRAVGSADGLALARVHGADSRLELAAITGGAIRRVEVPDAAQSVSPDILAVPGAYAVLFIEHQSLMLQWFDSQLQPVGSRASLARAGTGARLHSARFIHGASGRVAVAYRLLHDSGGFVTIPGEANRPDRRQPVRAVSDHIMAYDIRSRRAGPVLDMAVPGIWYDASGWVGDTLLVLAGENPVRSMRFRGV